MDLNNTGNRALAGAIILVLIGGAWWIGRNSQVLSPASGATETGEGKPVTSDRVSGGAKETGGMQTPSTLPSGETVNVADQSAGSTVVVRSVTLVKMGWVAVRDNEGRILGAARFDEGTHSGVVELLRNTAAGSSYQVLLYVDDGDRAFDLHKDILVSESDGTVAGTTFHAL